MTAPLRRRWICTLLLLLLPAAAPAAPVCPPDTIDAGCILLVDRYVTTLPGATCQGSCTPWHAGEPCPGACYDLTAGTLAVFHPGGIDCVDYVTVYDQFWVSGPAPGTPVELTARLRVAGTMTNATGQARLWEDGGQAASVAFTAADPVVNTTLSIPVTHEAGELFGLHAQLGAYSWEGFHLTATLEFTGPAGTTVLSCQGFDRPVPAVPFTWGRLRGLYR